MKFRAGDPTDRLFRLHDTETDEEIRYVTEFDSDLGTVTRCQLDSAGQPFRDLSTGGVALVTETRHFRVVDQDGCEFCSTTRPGCDRLMQLIREAATS